MRRSPVRRYEAPTPCFLCGVHEEPVLALRGDDRKARWVCRDCAGEALARLDRAEREQIAALEEIWRAPARCDTGGGLVD